MVNGIKLERLWVFGCNYDWLYSSNSVNKMLEVGAHDGRKTLDFFHIALNFLNINSVQDANPRIIL